MLIQVSLHPVALKGVVPTNYPATIEPYGLRRPKSTNALMANCCTRRQRPSCRRAAEQRDELASPHHSITSSARMEVEAMFFYGRRGQRQSVFTTARSARRRASTGAARHPDTPGARKAKVFHQVNQA